MKVKLNYLLFQIVGALLFMTDAFYNGFPILYSDTSTYIASGMQLETPFDRPITYGLFLRAASLNGITLWTVVFFQCLVLSYVIFETVKLLVGEKNYLRNGLLICLFLALFTGVSWTASQLMPDIYTAIAFLLFLLIVLGTYSRNKLIFLYFLYLVAIAMHMSHILLFSALLVLTYLAKKKIVPELRLKGIGIKSIVLFSLTLAAIVTMGSAMSKSKHVFLMGGMVEKGILKQYLDDNCASHNYQLCAYKDSLPDNFTDFVWEQDSPLYKIGWKESKPEFNEIIYATLTQPKYIWMHIRESVKATFKQLVVFNIADGNGSFLDGTVLYERVNKYFPGDVNSYTASRQSAKEFLYVKLPNVIFQVVVVLSLLILVWYFFRSKKVSDSYLLSAFVLTLLLIFLNAWDCGTFSMVTDRFSCKVIWLVPFLACIALFKMRDSRKLQITNE